MDAEGSGWETRSDFQPDGLDNCLRGSRGVSVKYYVNPSKASMIFMVHFGEGCEGWPGIVHGGCLSSFMHNAIECFASSCFPPPQDFDGTDESYRQLRDEGYYQTTKFEMSFEKPVVSGDVYAIHVVPAYALHPSIMNDARLEAVHLPKIAPEDYQRSMIASLMQIEYFPWESQNGRQHVRYGTAVGTFGKVGDSPMLVPEQLQVKDARVV